MLAPVYHVFGIRASDNLYPTGRRELQQRLLRVAERRRMMSCVRCSMKVLSVRLFLWKKSAAKSTYMHIQETRHGKTRRDKTRRLDATRHTHDTHTTSTTRQTRTARQAQHDKHNIHDTRTRQHDPVHPYNQSRSFRHGPYMLWTAVQGFGPLRVFAWYASWLTQWRTCMYTGPCIRAYGSGIREG